VEQGKVVPQAVVGLVAAFEASIAVAQGLDYLTSNKWQLVTYGVAAALAVFVIAYGLKIHGKVKRKSSTEQGGCSHKGGVVYLRDSQHGVDRDHKPVGLGHCNPGVDAGGAATTTCLQRGAAGYNFQHAISSSTHNDPAPDATSHVHQSRGRRGDRCRVERGGCRNRGWPGREHVVAADQT
jgi:hypothetical protein